MFGFFNDPFYNNHRYFMTLLLNDEENTTEKNEQITEKNVEQPTNEKNEQTLTTKPNQHTYFWSPKADITETLTHYQISTELPGVSKDNIDIQIKDGVMTITGKKETHKEEQTKENEKTYHRMERTYGSFSRSFALPESIKLEEIKAENKDGVLHISIPKKEKKENTCQKIPIN